MRSGLASLLLFLQIPYPLLRLTKRVARCPPLSVDTLFSFPDQNLGRGANRRENRKKKSKGSTASRICNLLPTLVNPCAEIKAPPHPPGEEGTCPPPPSTSTRGGGYMQGGRRGSSGRFEVYSGQDKEERRNVQGGRGATSSG